MANLPPPLYGKSPPTQIPYVILGQHVRFFLGEGGEKSHRWGTNGELFTIYGILSGGGEEIHGGGEKAHMTPYRFASSDVCLGGAVMT